MSNILSVSVSSSFSTSSLDATGTDAEVLDPRFVEELQGALGQQDAGQAAQTVGAEPAPEEPDASNPVMVPDLQNLPLMPWVSMAMPANFAPQDSVSNRPDQALGALDVVAVAGVVGLQPTPGADGVSNDLPLSQMGTQLTDNLVPVAMVAPPVAQSLSSDLVSASVVDTQSVTTTDLNLLGAGAASTPVQVDTMAHEGGSPTTTSVAAFDETSRTPLSGAVMSAEGADTQGGVMAAPRAPSLQASQAFEPSVGHGDTPGDSHANAASAVELPQPLQTPEPTMGVKVDPSLATSGVQAPFEPTVGMPGVTRAAPLDTQSSVATAPVTQRDNTTRLDGGALGMLETPSSAEVVATVREDTPGMRAGADALELMPASWEKEPQRFDAESGTQTAEMAATVTSPSSPELTAASFTSQIEGVVKEVMLRADAVEAGDSSLQNPVATSESTLISAPVELATTAVVRSTTALADSVENAQEQRDMSPEAVAVRAQQNRLDIGASMDRQTDDSPFGSASTVTTSAKTSAAVLQESWTVGQRGLPAQDGRTAESTFASSFVQALMGQGHPGVTHHSQVLEVAPAPVPMAPHQVRLDAGQVQVEVVRLVKQGGGQVVMELTPPDESKFKIDLSISQQGVARLVVDGASESTRLRLEQTVSGLQDQFQQMGLQLQLDMRQSHQQESRAQAEAAPLDSLSPSPRASQSEMPVSQPVNARPSWEQGQVYLVA